MRVNLGLQCAVFHFLAFNHGDIFLLDMLLQAVNHLVQRIADDSQLVVALGAYLLGKIPLLCMLQHIQDLVDGAYHGMGVNKVAAHGKNNKGQCHYGKESQHRVGKAVDVLLAGKRCQGPVHAFNLIVLRRIRLPIPDVLRFLGKAG